MYLCADIRHANELYDATNEFARTLSICFTREPTAFARVAAGSALREKDLALGQQYPESSIYGSLAAGKRRFFSVPMLSFPPCEE